MVLKEMNMNNTALKLVSSNDDFKHFQTEEEIRQEFALSAKTSIARKSVSAPLKQFIAQYPHFIDGSALNYAKGREEHCLDTIAISELAGNCREYDYTFKPDIDVLKAHFNFVYCGYCVNTLPPAPRMQVWRTLAKLCSEEKGVVVVAARSNTDRGIKGEPCFDGVRTSKLGTFQIGYHKNQLKQEALEQFEYVEEIGTKGAYRIVICSHSPIQL